jgi:hypothetical protein
VIRSFANQAAEDLFNGVDSRRARAACPSELWPVDRRKLTQLNRVKEGLLLGSGRIHLGFDPDKSEAEAVVYRVERGGRPSPVASPRRD